MGWFLAHSKSLSSIAPWFFQTQEEISQKNTSTRLNVKRAGPFIEHYIVVNTTRTQLKHSALDSQNVSGMQRRRSISGSQPPIPTQKRIKRAVSFPVMAIEENEELNTNHMDIQDLEEKKEWWDDVASGELCSQSVTSNLFAEDDMKFDEPLVETLAMQVDRVLGGSLGHIYSRPIHTLPLTEVEREKMQVKNKLRDYDTAFISRNGRKPSRKEKEHLWPLYRRYFALRSRLEVCKENVRSNLKVSLSSPNEVEVPHMTFSGTEPCGWVHSTERFDFG